MVLKKDITGPISVAELKAEAEQAEQLKRARLLAAGRFVPGGRSGEAVTHESDGPTPFMVQRGLSTLTTNQVPATYWDITHLDKEFAHVRKTIDEAEALVAPPAMALASIADQEVTDFVGDFDLMGDSPSDRTPRSETTLMKARSGRARAPLEARAPVEARAPAQHSRWSGCWIVRSTLGPGRRWRDK